MVISQCIVPLWSFCGPGAKKMAPHHTGTDEMEGFVVCRMDTP